MKIFVTIPLFLLVFGVTSLDVFASSLFRSEESSYPLIIPKEMANGAMVPFISHKEGGPFQRALAMNLPSSALKKIRTQIETALGHNLKFFTGWDSKGEAHITTVTPPEFGSIFSSYISMQEIEEIALKNEIQSSDIAFEGVGRGQVTIAGRKEETYFLIVRSEKLLKIRRELYKFFVNRGGNPKAWDPEHFYPHITIGFTTRDLHEADGVIKDKAHSLDPRWIIDFEPRF